MIIVIGCNKGGAGKTTVATNLAVALAAEGADVCLVDADQQGSAAQWHAVREERKLEPVLTLVEKRGDIEGTLRKLRRKFDYLVVDVPGRSSLELISAMKVADLIIAPHQCSQLDLDTLHQLENQVEGMRIYNRKLNVRVYQTMASTNPVVKDVERADFLAFVDQFKRQMQPLESVNHYRKAYRDVIPGGLSVLEYDNAQALAEVRDLVREVIR